jgi:ABC-type glycerol-3-phosphate transport system substrate-binding protein
MKKILFTGFLFATIILAGCGGKGKAAKSGQAPDLFSGKIEGEITVSAYNTVLYKNYLEEAARAFEARYPKTKVKIETFSAMPEVRTTQQGDVTIGVSQAQDDSQSRADYLNRVSTKIMSGSGADVYAMDILPLNKFAESGNLENLERYMNMDMNFNKEDYRQNIIEAMRYRDGIWLMPVSYNFYYYSYDPALVPAEIASGFGIDKAWSLKGLFDLGSAMYDGTYKLLNITDYEEDGGDLFTRLLREEIGSFVNMETKRVNFTDGGFAELLKSVRQYGEQGFVFQGITGHNNAEKVLQQKIDAITNRTYFGWNGDIFLVDKYRRYSGLMPIFSAMSAGSEIAGIQAYADGSVRLNNIKAFGINNYSKNKAAAWAFVKFLLSGEMQSSNTDMALPINNIAREEKEELFFTGAIFGGMAPELNESQRNAMEDFKTALEKLSDKINSLVVVDTNISDMIANEARYFFQGSRSAEDTARVLQNKVELYLSE